MRTIENYFLTRYNGYSSATIFSTYATVYGSHNVKFAFIERENIFLHVYPQPNFLKLGLCVF